MTKHNSIWYYFTLLCLLLSVSIPLSATEPEIIVDPEFIEVELTGGEYNTTILTVKWTGKDAIQCFISTDITSDCGNDSEGINVAYSENSPFLLEPGINHVEMTIKAAINIMPGNYTITTIFSCKAEEPSEEDDDGDGGKGRGRSSPVNIPPVADASIGEPYDGYVDEEITFDGSNSSDLDGTITEWSWDFDDGTNGTGETTTHNYSIPGTYNVTLTVTDDNRDTDTYETTVIIMQANRPPAGPIVDGVMLGNKTVEYTYTAVSIDHDNDTIRYFFDWGDGTNRTSDFLENGTIYNTSHNWTTSGVYTVAVYAEDENNALSGTTEMNVFIDMNVQFIDDVIQGYLLDTNDDGIYDIFHNNVTGNETTVELQDNGNYRIDSDGDTVWDYEYDPETSTLASYTPVDEEERNMSLWYALITLIVMIAISIIIFVYFVHRVKKKEK